MARGVTSAGIAAAAVAHERSPTAARSTSGVPSAAAVPKGHRRAVAAIESMRRRYRGTACAVVHCTVMDAASIVVRIARTMMVMVVPIIISIVIRIVGMVMMIVVRVLIVALMVIVLVVVKREGATHGTAVQKRTVVGLQLPHLFFLAFPEIHAGLRTGAVRALALRHFIDLPLLEIAHLAGKTTSQCVAVSEWLSG